MNLNQNRTNILPQPRKIDIKHYISLLLEKKWWIVFITLLISIVWYFFYPLILEKEKQYYFWAVIRFDDPRIDQSASGFDDRFTRIETESKIRVISTTPFLTKVVDSLKLNIVSPSREISREEIFADINLNKDYLKYGSYTLRKKNNSDMLELLYTNKQENKKNYFLQNIVLTSGETFAFNMQGISTVVYSNIFKERDIIEFDCLPTRYILESIRTNLTLDLNRQQTLLTIAYHQTDPLLGTKITNTIADMFLEQSIEFKQARTTGAMHALEEQLKSSKAQLEQVEEELKNFRENNPNIYLTENLAEYNRTLTENEIERDQIKNNLDRLSQLINEKDKTHGFNERVLIFQEILTFLQEQNIGGITALNEQYADLIEQRTLLVEQNYSEENPRMKEVNSNLRSMQQTIDERTNQYLNQKYTRYDYLINTIQQSEHRMRLSPSKELQLAKLQRDRESKSQVYSSVLLRYNEIKTAHASITPDAYLLESAQIPIIAGGIMIRIIKMIKIFLGVFLGFGFAIVLIIGLDFIWHRARSIEDMEGLLKLPVLATIPLLESNKDIEKLIEIGKKMDPLLVTIDYTPSAGGDAFRNLRTRLILNKNEETKIRLVVTSLMPNEGKSLVASNLAITFAQLKKQTLLVDADIRRGVIHNTFLCNKKPGLSNLLAREKEINRDNIGQVIQKTTIPNLYLLTSGSSVPNPTEILISDKIENMFDILQRQFHYIIFDTPPIDFIPDAFVINKFVQNMLIVTRYGETNINRLKKKLNEYENIFESIKGIVLNASTDVLVKKYQAYSYYKY